jgi:hypothetical protein
MSDRPTKTTKGRGGGAGAAAAPPPRPSATAAKAAAQVKPETAFDIWLERGLHKLFDNIAQEPIPEALLKIIEQDRNK